MRAQGVLILNRAGRRWVSGAESVELQENDATLLSYAAIEHSSFGLIIDVFVLLSDRSTDLLYVNSPI